MGRNCRYLLPKQALTTFNDNRNKTLRQTGLDECAVQSENWRDSAATSGAINWAGIAEQGLVVKKGPFSKRTQE